METRLVDAGRDVTYRSFNRIRNRREKYPSCPVKTRYVGFRMLNDLNLADVFFEADVSRALYEMLGVVDGASHDRPVGRALLLRLFLQIREKLAGPSCKMLLDQQKEFFFGSFREMFELHDSTIEYVDAAWRHRERADARQVFRQLELQPIDGVSPCRPFMPKPGGEFEYEFGYLYYVLRAASDGSWERPDDC